MGENSFEKINQPGEGIDPEKEQEKKEKRKMSREEVVEMGGEMEGYLHALLSRKEEIRKELKLVDDKEQEEELREELKFLEEQIELDQEGLEGFIEDIESGDFSEPMIDK